MVMRYSRGVAPGRQTLPGALLLVAVAAPAAAQSFEPAVAPLVETSCLACHGERTVTPLDLTRLGFDLADRETSRTWERIYERVERGEMPPATAPRPDADVVETALAGLKRALVEASVTARDGVRTPLQRLTRLEYTYTIQDLLLLDEDVAARVGDTLPAEADSGGFDTVAATQSMSPLHVQAYLDAADAALDEAIVLGPRPATTRHTIDYGKSRILNGVANARALGAGVVKMLDDAAVQFFAATATYLFHSAAQGYQVPHPGRYRLTLEAYPHQADTPVTLTLYSGRIAGQVAALDTLIGVFDLVNDAPRSVELTKYLRPGDVLSPSVADLEVPPGPPVSYYQPDKNVRDYTGEGIAMKSLTIEGPLVDAWPPASTRQLLAGVEFDDDGQIRLTKAPYEHVVDVVAAFAPRAFRRPLEPGELEAYASLAEPLLAEDRPFLEAVRVPLRAILIAPSFVYRAGDAGELDDYALATRLSYFLWRTMPDAELFALARDGRLADAEELARQVDRLLDDDRSNRFVRDFAGQAYRLYELKATAPDPGLYPEYDDTLGQAMALETEMFLAELIAGNHGAGNLIDADFTFLNRRLAQHYGVPGVEAHGEQLRKTALPADSPRGGLLTHASVLKVTANGTTTSPVPRGNFVLANLLGQPPAPPPPGVGSLEPDTRGTETVREQLTAHRANPVCASCHRRIDPPGFALESFDPIGGFRTSYRASGGEVMVGGFQRPMPAPYTIGPAVDASGVTPVGDAFAGFAEYKRLMLRNDTEQVARHLASQLLTFATGAEIAFADRDVVEGIVARGRAGGYPIRTMIHEAVQSDLFRRR